MERPMWAEVADTTPADAASTTFDLDALRAFVAAADRPACPVSDTLVSDTPVSDTRRPKRRHGRRITFQCPPDIWARLEVRAKTNSTTLTAELVRALRAGLAG